MIASLQLLTTAEKNFSGRELLVGSLDMNAREPRVVMAPASV
jgi:hypothetical protein